MCEPLMLKAARRDGHYDFSHVFDEVRADFESSDFVIGNLETPLAGENAGYTRGLFSFNSPDEFADAVKGAGIDLVITANNHCLDRGTEGMARTMAVLKQKGLPFIGTCLDPAEKSEAFYFSEGDTKIAVVAYTYGTNYSANRVLLKDGSYPTVNLLRPQQELYYIPKPDEQSVSLAKKGFNCLLRHMEPERRYAVKKALGMQYNQAHEDDNLNEQTARPFIEKMTEDIRTAKKQADIVILILHIGGQFNACPGAFSKYVFSMAREAGCDAIVASHPHVVQKASLEAGIPCYYSIGNFSMSPNSVYLLHQNLPAYGLTAQLYVEKGRIVRSTFSIVKMVEKKKEMLKVWPVDRLYGVLKPAEREALIRDIKKVYHIVTGKEVADAAAVRYEYDL